ncbi:beta-lactamase [Clathrospora elynae]|uniref:Beta-lactamase n=1 Tax=Clathrospora elynae TaxID=706981 RepID=A0A6A5S985_9PLEO|nr:beta-lactamase [Clathrospora elynae]
MAKVRGICDDRFKQVEKLLQDFIDSGDELGASICVNVHGKDVLDIWGGYADAAHTRPWEKDTVTCVWSSSKTVLSLATLLCIDRGLLDPYEKVSKYWPEFVANGKEKVEVRHLLSHASGLSGWQESITLEETFDLESSTKLLEQQAPWWEPGTASGYHSFTMGHLVDGLIHRVTGKPVKQFIAEELAGPLNADFQLGVKEQDWGRVADIIPPPPPATIPEGLKNPMSIMFRTLAINPGMNAEAANEPGLRNASVPAVNGYSNARALTRLLSSISLSLSSFALPISLSQKAIDYIFTEQQHCTDLVVCTPVRFGIGFAISSDDPIMGTLPKGRVATWGGWGGSQVVIDVDRGVTIAYVMNKMENSEPGKGDGGMGNERTEKYIGAIYEALGLGGV